MISMHQTVLNGTVQPFSNIKKTELILKILRGWLTDPYTSIPTKKITTINKNMEIKL